MDEMRKAFEAWAASEPREWDIYRWGDHCTRPGNYCDDNVQCTWEAWQAACAAEREACAAICDEHRSHARIGVPWIAACAASIRARSKQ